MYNIDSLEVLHPTQHKIGHFRDILPSRSLGWYAGPTDKLKQTQQKQTCIR